MTPDARRQLVSWSALLLLSGLFTVVLVSVVAHFMADKHLPPESEASFLTRTGQPCLGHVPPPDVEPSEAWRAHWQRLQEEDCQPGSWLYTFREDGQDVAGYQASDPVRGPLDAPLVLIQLGAIEGEASAALVEPVRRFLEVFFQREVLAGDRLELPEQAFHPDKGQFGQFDAEALLTGLIDACPPDSGVCMGITERDLFVDDLQYVFGLGHFRQRVGVFSTYRLWADRTNPRTGRTEPAPPPEPLRRALKVAVHELAHEFSIAHCVHYRRCIMGGTNSLAESDAGSLMLCPMDHEKLRWNLGFDPHERFVGLADFAEDHGLHGEARYWRRMAREYPAYANVAGGGR
jgi:archaemetzincin